jgi:hypothetical protein
MHRPTISARVNYVVMLSLVQRSRCGSHTYILDLSSLHKRHRPPSVS